MYSVPAVRQDGQELWKSHCDTVATGPLDGKSPCLEIGVNILFWACFLVSRREFGIPCLWETLL